MNKDYVFKSERLGFRNWRKDDLAAFAELNADPDVMEHFPKTLTRQESAALIERFQNQFKQFGYTYFATEILETSEFIGFIGLAYQDYESDFNPSTDIGWRLKKSAWRKGYATEGATRCLVFAFKELKLARVISTCLLKNTKSEHVMKKIGMVRKGEFYHPKLKAYPEHEKCIWYEIRNE